MTRSCVDIPCDFLGCAATSKARARSLCRLLTLNICQQSGLSTSKKNVMCVTAKYKVDGRMENKPGHARLVRRGEAGAFELRESPLLASAEAAT